MDMANSMLTGHDGSLSTGHGNSAREMMLRLETMILMGYDMPVAAIRGQLSAAIDIVIHLGRLRDNSRRVLEVCEVTGVENGQICLNTIYEFIEAGSKDGKVIGALKKTGDLNNVDKIIRSGEMMSLKEKKSG
jgi:pilus assembly protein CpaF